MSDLFCTSRSDASKRDAGYEELEGQIRAPTEGYRSSQQPMPHSRTPISESGVSPYRESSYGYPYHHPTRYQSLSTGSAHSFDRTPFTPGAYNTPYQDFVRFGDMGPASLSGDNKQRKRRGNLPKETTDKLRAWFVAHLQHPYPTEDEKQDLMRQTGLQMSESSQATPCQTCETLVKD